MFPKIQQRSLGSTSHIVKLSKSTTPVNHHHIKYCDFMEQGSLIARLKKVQDFLDKEEKYQIEIPRTKRLYSMEGEIERGKQIESRKDTEKGKENRQDGKRRKSINKEKGRKLTEPKECIIPKLRKPDRIKLNSLTDINQRISKALSIRISEKIKFFKVF